ncbi:ArsR family transcriptional regulator [Rhodovulum imhoffii]|uniref:ArsR family transcriptional regulator n=1 Tax=Rhodovulum imhoffii TaxID=365340 RepID=A0A2T5BTI8_9RHOB|nr:helix-turn-helix domain-containing protein [Rhodovulum imhoffii]MBK5934306.1 ArsR family transcriptional regulator [Rhodovulum imhoffii]PTN02746.1 ArsR family transcriptional regulator [Rhodovulum imhoffii]
MEEKAAIAAFAALAHEIRLDVFRLLVKVGPGGMLAGQIGEKLGVLQNTLSTNLTILLNAGLVKNRREGRAIRYFADMNGVGIVLTYLLEDCCGNRSELCRPLLENLLKDKTMADVYNVLFLCTGNSARSILAESILNAEGAGRFRAFSAGSRPAGKPHPFAVDLLEGLKHDTSFVRSKSWDEFCGPGAPKMDFVFTVCDSAAAEPCPLWPGHPMSAHWGMPDPAAVTGTDAEKRLAFAETYRMLNRRILAFVNLPLATLDGMSLKQRLDTIGKARVGQE